MFAIIGWFVTIITFPGVITHEIAHRFFADLAKVPVYKVCYFSFGNPAGYVIHGPVEGLKDAFLISVGPLIVNSIFCSLLTFFAVFPEFFLGATEYSGIFVLLAWVGYSIGMHAFPSDDDMENFVNIVKNERRSGFLLVISKALAFLMQIANALKFFWFDAIYAFGVSMFLPLLFLVFS